MTQIALCSAKGSPGVTSLACVMGAVWPPDRAVLVAECDPSGGDLAGRFGLSTRVGLASMILTERQRKSQLTDHRPHVQQLPGGLDVLVGPCGADSAMALDRELGMAPSGMGVSGCDVLADCGRLLPGAVGQERIVGTSDRVLLLVRPDVSGVAHAQSAVPRVQALGSAPTSLVIVGSGDFSPSHVAEALAIDVLGTIPFDLRAARLARGGVGSAKAFARSALVVFARALVSVITDQSKSESKVDTHFREWSRNDDDLGLPSGPSERPDTVSPLSRWMPMRRHVSGDVVAR
jgi:MinD-like ATPase involved in chromosome partitioning or flagellar assembly